MRRFGAFVVLSLLAASLAATQQQEPPQQPIFRGGVTLINVDVYPRADGKIVEGLRPEDFQIFEDGKPQAIEAFEFIRIEPNAPDAERRDPNTKEEGDALAADPHSRVFVVYLDIYHTTFAGAREARRPLLDFLNRLIGPSDLFGVLTPEVPVQQLVFARRTDTLAAEMTNNYFDWGLQDRQDVLPRTPIEERLYAFCAAGPELIRLHREDAFMSSLEELVVRLGVLKDERKNVLLVSEGWVLRRAAPIQTQGTRDAPPPLPPIGVTPGGRLGDVVMPGTNNSAFCSRELARLAGIDFERRFKDLLTASQRANVSFYPLDVGGLKTFAPTASMRGVPSIAAMRDAGQSRIDTLRILADNTDGRAVVNTNDIDAGVRRIADDLSAYYLLGYASTNTAVDGKFRRIDVKVNRPRVSVAARRGYLAPSPATVAAVAAAEKAAAVPATVAQELGRLSRLRLDADVFAYAARTAVGVDVVAEIAAQEMARGRWSSGADVRVAIARDGGEPIVSTGRIEPGARGAVVHVPLGANAAASPRATVTVASAGGSLDSPVELPAEPATPPLVGDPICFRGTAAARVALRPVADFQFRRTERLHVEWPVATALDERTATLLDRRGQPLPLSVPVTQPSGATLAVDLLLAPLAEGDYVIEVDAKRGEQSEKRLLAFRVVR